MWIELIALPWKQAHGNKLLIWFDNSSIHLTHHVMAMFWFYGIDIALFPKNMTCLLQPLDLSCNGPFKKMLRAMLVERLLGLFVIYKRLYRLASDSERRKLHFNPPKPSLAEVIPFLIKIVNDFSTGRVGTALKNDFVTVGMVPNEDGVFATYCARNKTYGTFLVEPESFVANYFEHVANAVRDTDAFDATNQEEMSIRDALLARCIDVENDSDSEDDEEQDM